MKARIGYLTFHKTLLSGVLELVFIRGQWLSPAFNNFFESKFLLEEERVKGWAHQEHTCVDRSCTFWHIIHVHK